MSLRKSGYYWRCACGFETHSYAVETLALRRDAHRLYHDAQVRRIISEE